ncbi:MAG: outer membrane beta-barrel protein [Cytophagales bacterium]
MLFRSGGIVNGWDAIYDNNKYRSGVAQVFISPFENFNIYLNWIGGHEDGFKNGAINYNTDKKELSMRHLFDLTTGYQITDKFYIGVNAAYGMVTKQLNEENGELNKTKTWGGAALYSNYKINDIFGIGARIEKFDNSSGAIFLTNKRVGVNPVGTDVTSFTLTPNISLDGGKLILKPEFRLDMAAKKADGDDVQQYEDDKGMFSKTTQSTFGMAAIFMF